MCPRSALAQTEAAAAPRLPGGEKEEKMEPVPLQMPLSLLPFCLSFFHFPWLFMNSAITVVTMPEQAPPQVALGSSLG